MRRGIPLIGGTRLEIQVLRHGRTGWIPWRAIQPLTAAARGSRPPGEVEFTNSDHSTLDSTVFAEVDIATAGEVFLGTFSRGGLSRVRTCYQIVAFPSG